MTTINPFSAAESALFTTQQLLGVVSENVGNSQNQNFTQLNATTSNPDPQAQGFTKVTVTRAVNQTLQSEVLSQTTASGNAAYVNQFYNQLDTLTGSNTTSPVLSTAVTQLATAFQAFQSQPENQTAQNQVLSAAQNLVQQVTTLTSGITSLQSQTQAGVTSDVKTLNSALTQLQTLNTQIVATRAAGGSSVDEENQRDQLIAQVAKLVPIRQQQNNDGTTYLYTPDGVTLLDQTASQFAFDPSTSAPGQTSVAGEPTSGVLYLATDPNNTAINGSFSGGEIGAQLNILRADTAAIQSTDPSMAPLAKLQQQLNAFVDLFYVASPGTATAFQAAYNNASPTNTNELASNLFVINTATPTSPNDANNFVVNPALTSIVSPNTAIQTIKQSAAAAVTAVLGQSLTYGGGTTNINATSGTLSQIATIIASDQSSRSSAAQTAATTAGTNLSTAQTSYQAQSGVNLDQQLSLLVVLQNSYNAAAKIIGAVDKLQQTLFAAV